VPIGDIADFPDGFFDSQVPIGDVADVADVPDCVGDIADSCRQHRRYRRHSIIGDDADFLSPISPTEIGKIYLVSI